MNHKDFAQIPQKNADKEKLLYNPSSGRSTDNRGAPLTRAEQNKKKYHFDGLPFKRSRGTRRSAFWPLSLLWLLSVATESDKKKSGKWVSNPRP
jgi:hypothetical protein